MSNDFINDDINDSINNNIIISQPWGGLGDNLQYSTLPELYHKIGKDVYIHPNNVVRNREIYDLVWGKNPYIKGIKNGEVNAGEVKNSYWPEENKYCFIHRIEISHGFSPTNVYPKIYYIPRLIEDIKDITLVDLSGTSQVYNEDKYHEYITKIKDLIPRENTRIIRFEKFSTHPVISKIYEEYMKDYETYTIKNIYEYCDVIRSCNTIIIVNSGINSLASAIKTDKSSPRIICYNPWKLLPEGKIRGFYNYPNVEYISTEIG